MSESEIQGPYWVRTATNGEHQVCGRNGEIIRRYPPNQIAGASADARALHRGYTSAQRALRDAAPDLLAAAQVVLAGLNERIDSAPKNAVPVFAGIAELHAAIAKATGK